MNRKGFAPILVFAMAALILGAAVGYFAWKKIPTSTQISKSPLSQATFGAVAISTTAPSATFDAPTPDGFGFGITTLAGWKYEVTSSSEANIKSVFKYESSDAKKSFLVSVFSNTDPAKMILAQWAKQDMAKYDANAQNDPNGKIGTNFGSYYSGEIRGRTYKRLYLIRGIEQQIYRISVEMDKNNLWISDFDKMISTFKFFEPKTNNYQTYKNLQFSFELTYPSTWRAVELPQGVAVRNYYNFVLDLPSDPLEISIDYMKDKNPEKLSLDNWLKIDFNKIYVSGEKYREKVNIGDEAIKSVGDGLNKTPGKSVVTYLIRNGEDIIFISYGLDDAIKHIYNPDQIISTLKFTPFDQAAYNSSVQQVNN